MKLFIRNNDDYEKKYTETPEETDIFCMSNLRGSKIVVPHKLPFSFYFSARESSHAIRVKPVFNPNRMSRNNFGTLELHGNWEYTPSPDDADVSNKQIKEMKEFFRTYKVLFAAVWEEELPEDSVQSYFQGHISWSELLSELYFYNKYEIELNGINTIEKLEEFVRENKLFNMWD